MKINKRNIYNLIFVLCTIPNISLLTYMEYSNAN